MAVFWRADGRRESSESCLAVIVSRVIECDAGYRAQRPDGILDDLRTRDILHRPALDADGRTPGPLGRWLGRPGADPGEFANPWSAALDAQGNLYVADSMNHRVQKFVRRAQP